MTTGLKIAPTGKNVLTTPEKNLAFSSGLDSFKIVKQGRVSVSVPALGGNVTITVDHALGYTPAFLAFAQLLDTGSSYSIDSFSVTSGKGEGFQVRANQNKIEFILSSCDTTYTGQVYYYLFVEAGRKL